MQSCYFTLCSSSALFIVGTGAINRAPTALTSLIARVGWWRSGLLKGTPTPSGTVK
ncbi:MAG: hypothetical protein JO011_12645 [Ktedonobacteraceae bacterium]|nr:hypothetical protein [Ktedonobacteraceae bacterium]